MNQITKWGVVADGKMVQIFDEQADALKLYEVLEKEKHISLHIRELRRFTARRKVGNINAGQ